MYLHQKMHTYIIIEAAYGSHVVGMPVSIQRNYGFLYSGIPVSIFQNRGVKSPGILTKLPQGKKSIADHIRPGLFMDLDTDSLHFQTDRGRM